MKRYGWRVMILAALTTTIAAQRANACAIPVFRYALERWVPDNYAVIVLHRGPLSPSARTLVDRLRAAEKDPEHPANLEVTMRDLQRDPLKPSKQPDKTPVAGDTDQPPKNPQQGATTASDLGAKAGPGETASASTAPVANEAAEAGGSGADPRDAALVALLNDEPKQLPRMVLLLPLPGFPPVRVWSGPLTDANVRRLVNSPARRTITDRLLAGDSAVWVLVLSGDKAKDERAETTLRRELARMEKVLELPAPEVLAAEEAYRPDTPVELRVGFSLVTIRRDDSAEAIFKAMLLASEPDLADYSEPIAVPVFGRGRTYLALVGKGIQADNIEENCRFLCDGCSCMIKQQNPGIDMLLAANWDEHIQGSAMPDLVLPELTGIGALAADAEGEVSKPVDVSKASVALSAPQAGRGDSAATPALNSDPAPAVAPRDRPAIARRAVANEDASAAAETASAEDRPTTAWVPSTGQFARKMLLWTLAGVGLAAVVVLVGSLWMRAR